MKRSVLLVALLSLVVSSCTYEQKERQNWRESFNSGHLVDYFPLYGDVQKVTVYRGGSYEKAFDEDSFPEGRIVATLWLDEYGDVVESEMDWFVQPEGCESSGCENIQYKYSPTRKILAIKSSGGDSSQNEYFEYDMEDNLIKHSRYLSEDGSIIISCNYQYESGKLVAMREKDSAYKEWNDSFRYEYDAQGNKIEERKYDYQGNPKGKTCWEYDSDGNLVSESRYGNMAPLYWLSHSIIEYKYNWRGRLSEMVVSDYSDEGLDEKTCCKYDFRGNLSEKVEYHYDDGKLDYKVCSKCDSRGNVAEKLCYDNKGAMYRAFFYKYDTCGNLTEQAVCDCKDGVLEPKNYEKLHEYKYDKHGNMIAKADFSYGDTVVYRYKIVYR